MSLEKVVFFYKMKISMFVFGEHTVIKNNVTRSICIKCYIATIIGTLMYMISLE